jgi:uncharacterized protein involved in outer membrane biogenesis
MNRVLLAIGGLLVGLLATLFAAPAMVDWNRYRGVLEEEATRFLGREVRLGGKVNLRLLPVPYVQFEQVRVADTRGSVGRPMFMAENFTVWLSVSALLSGAIEAKNIELKKPTVTLVLDGKGGGNWSSLSPEHFRGSYIPARVAFDSVRITGGTLTILGPDGTLKTKFADVDGELSAQALEGPYRLVATFARGEEAREIRLSTAKAAEDGSVRFKGTIRDPSSGVSYSLEGDAHDVLSNIKVAGQLTARLPLPASLASKAKGGFLGSLGAQPQPGGEFDMRAALEGDTKGFKLTDLSLSFEHEGRPQLATGGASVNWTDHADISVTLKSHWLDLDKIAGAGTGGTPLELAQGVAAAVSRILATEGRTQSSLTIDQATLGGEVVSNLTAVLEYNRGQLNVKSLSAALPGGARLAASGSFDGPQTDLRYSGRVVLRGASMARFAGWAMRDRKLELPTRDGPFTLVGDLSLGSKELAGHNLTLEMGRNMLTGDASWKAGEPQQIVLNLEGSELDLSPVVPSGSEPAKALRDLISGLAGVKTDRKSAVGPADADIKLRIDRLIVGAASFRNAVAELKLAGGNLSVPQLRLASSEGYQIEMRGDIAGLGAEAKGALTGLAVAETAQGVSALARLAGLPPDLVPSNEDAAVMAPMRLAGRLSVGAKGPDTHDLSLDGTLAGSRIAGTLRLGKEHAEWRDRPVDFAATFDGEAARRLLAKALRVTATPSAATSGIALTVRGIGSPKAGMTVLAAIDAEGVSGAYRGQAALSDKNGLGLDGELSMSFKDLARGLALAGLPGSVGLDGPVSGTAHVERSDENMKVAWSRFRIGDAEASGNLVFKREAEATRVSGDLTLAEGSLQGLFALLSPGEVRRRESAPDASPWSEKALDLSIVERLAGSRVTLNVKRLALAPGLDVQDGQLELVARADGLDVRLSDATVLGGHGSGLLVLNKAPAGVRMLAEGAVTGLKLERIAKHGSNAPTAIGALTAMLKLQSTGLSPRGLVAALTGGGEVRLSQARLTRWTPAAVSKATEAVISLKGEIPPGALKSQLELALQAEGVPVGSQRLTATVADGAMRIEPMVITVSQGQLKGRLAVDLDHLQIDGEWRMEPRNSPQPVGLPPRPELPAVSIKYSGALANLPALVPRLDMAALEREVVVRKVEREVAELERLRKLDAQRASDEAARWNVERLKAEQRRLDALKRQQAEDAARVPPGVDTTVPFDPSGGRREPAIEQGAQNLGAAPIQQGRADLPDGSVERGPLPAPTVPPVAPTKAPRGDIFRPLRESSP